MKIIVGSGNKGKIRELQARSASLNWELIPQSDYGVSDIPETGVTFIENALLKARHAAACSGLPAIADDSGLIIPALNGAPGIYSARFAGVNASATENINKLLADMSELPDEKRIGFFYSVLIFLNDPNDPVPLISEGFWSGTILKTPRGFDGFGYDPIFFDTTHHKSAAEFSITEKNKISHRGHAITALIEKYLCKHSP